MDVDRFLAQPPAHVSDQGFSQWIAVGLYQARARRRTWLLAALVGVIIFSLALIPLGTVLRNTVWQLSALVLSPVAPFVGAGLLFFRFALPPRSFRL